MPLLQEQIPTLLALVKGCTSVRIVEQASDVAEGCSSETIGADIVVHLLVKGLINVDAELAKAEKKIALAQTSMNKLKVTLERTETPEEIKAKNSEEVRFTNDLLRLCCFDEMTDAGSPYAAQGSRGRDCSIDA